VQDFGRVFLMLKYTGIYIYIYIYIERERERERDRTFRFKVITIFKNSCCGREPISISFKIIQNKRKIKYY